MPRLRLAIVGTGDVAYRHDWQARHVLEFARPDGRSHAIKTSF